MVIIGQPRGRKWIKINQPQNKYKKQRLKKDETRYDRHKIQPATKKKTIEREKFNQKYWN